MFPWILIAIGTLILILAIAAIILRKRQKTPPDYYSFFIIGMVWTAVGFPMQNYAMGVLGLVFMFVGLVNKKKWRKNQRRWENLTPEQKRLVLLVSALIGIIIVLGFVLYFLIQK